MNKNAVKSWKNRSSSCGSGTLFLVGLILCLILLSAPAEAKTITVSADGTGDYSDISAAISAVSDGDTIYLKEGTYTETVQRNITASRVTIKGDGPDKTQINGGHWIMSGDGCNMEALKLYGNFEGITIIAPNCTVRNTILSGRGGIFLFSSSNLIENNVLLGLTQSAGIVFNSDTITGNIIRNNVIYGVSATTNGYGALIYGSSNTFDNNTVRNSVSYGITVRGTNNIISNNSITNNGNSGLYLYRTGNGNRVYLNTISGNSGNLVTVKTPASPLILITSDSVPYTYNGTGLSGILGNYWGSSYTSADADGNGIGDSAFTPLASYGADTAPLMGIWQNGAVTNGPNTVAPIAGFTASATSSQAPVSISFTSWIQGPGTVSSYAWDFGDGTTSTDANPSHTYNSAGTYTVNLTVTGPGGSTSIEKANLITVTSPGADLTVSAGPTSSLIPSPNLFAHYAPNSISATIKNTGTQDAGSFKVSFNVDGNVTAVAVTSLAASASTVVSTTDSVDRSVGASVPVTVTADAEGAVAESNEANNAYSYTAPVIRNGYAGMRWGDGPDIATNKSTTLHGDIIYSLGTSSYGSGSATWTASDLPIPAGATVKDARLYITYCWDSGNVMPAAAVTSFNGVSKTYDSFYSDKKNWGGYAYPFGLITYNVTDQFNKDGNSVSASGIPPIRGMELVVTYEDPTATEKQIFVNEGFDLLYASSSYYTTEETATAYAPFTGPAIDLGNVNKATLTTFINKGGSGDTRGTMLFNGQEYPNYWVQAGPEIGVNTTDVTPYLLSTGNTAGFRSLIANNMDMEPHLAILKVEYKGAVVTAPVAGFTSTSSSGTAPMTVVFTDTSTNSPTSWLWDFGDKDSTNATVQNPVHTYTAAGTYAVNLTATNAAGSSSSEQTGYVTITSAASVPVASFTTTVTNDLAPVPASFTDTSSNSPTSWLWEYRIADNGTWTQFSTVQNPTGVSFATVGTYDIRLTATNAAGNNTVTKTHVFAAGQAHDYLTGVQNGTVSGGLYVHSVSPFTTSSSQTFSLPAVAVNNITWARLYVNSYSGKADDAYALTSKVTFDGITIANETLNVGAQMNANAYPVNDHVMKVYSDYEAVYDVTGRITSANPAVTVTSTKIPGKSFDGRIKGITLVAAYNDGDSDVVKYVVNHGCDWMKTGVSSSTTLDAGPITTGWTDAEMRTVAFSSVDGTYTFPASASSITPTSLGTGGYWKYNSFDVTSVLLPGISNTLGFTAVGDSFKPTLATLVVKYPTTPVVTAPVAGFTSSATTGAAPYTVIFTDTSTNTPTSWLWDFGDGSPINATVQNPVHTYASAGTYTVNLTATNAAGSNTVSNTGYVTVSSGTVTGPDLEVTAMTYNTGGSYNFLFANETNTVSVTVKNNGTVEAGASVVSVDLSGVGYTANVGALAAGINQTVTITDTTIRMGSTAVTVTATADSTGTVAETSETNNVRTSAQTVYNHGYKGKRYTGGSDITTKAVLSGRNTLVYSPGSSSYTAAGWKGSTTSWTSTDLPVPAGSEIVQARLYQPYSYDQTTGGSPIWSASFNGNAITPEAVYKDRKGFGAYDYPYGLYVYNVTTSFSTTGNTLVLTNGSTNNNSLYGGSLVIVYRNTSDMQKTIYFNEEADLLIGKSTYAVTGEEATAYASFGSVDTTGMTGAKVVAIATGAGKGGAGNSKFLFNNHDYGDFVAGYKSSPQISMLATDVTGTIQSGSNTAGFQSTGTSADTIIACTAILVVESTPSVTAPVASFTSTSATGTAPFTVVFTDTSTNSPTSWQWDFGDKDATNATVQNPVHTYAAAGTYTVNLTATNAAGSSSSKQAGYVTVSSGTVSGPDLEVTAMTFNTGGSYNFLFANETNTVSVTVKNNGTAEAGASVVSLDLSGVGYIANVGALAAGANQTVTVTDTTIRMGTTAVAVTATADSTGLVAESDETDNIRTSAQTVYNHGYKGKRYTGGSDITTKEKITGHNTVLYSPGSSAYAGSSWKSSSTSWTSTDLPVPAGSEIITARLYQPYSYDQTAGGSPDWTAVFNGNEVTPVAIYKDRKGFGSYDYPYGLYVYNVTSGFSTAGNTFALTPGSTNNNALYGGYLVVVYRNTSDMQKTIYINEEADLLIGKTSYAVSGEEATAYAPFGSVETTGMTGAKVIAIATGAGKGGAGNSTFFFNNQDYGSFVPGYLGTPQIAILATDVTSTIQTGENTARFQSKGTSADTIIAGTSILVVESSPVVTVPAASFTSSTTTGKAPFTVIFTDTSTNSPTSWLWDFGDGSSTNATVQNPVHTFAATGNYMVNLTVTNAAGSSFHVIPKYITVGPAITPTSTIPATAAPVAAFKANKTEGDQPLAVKFTDQSTNAPTAWVWDFGDSSTSAEQSPVHTFTATGNYTVSLKAENAAGNNTLTLPGYISVIAPLVRSNTFAVENVTTTTVGGVQNVTIDTTGGNVTTSGNVVTISNTTSWSSLAITLAANTTQSTGTAVNGTVETVKATTEPVTAPIASVGTPTVQISLNMSAMPGTTAAITQTITKDPDAAAQSSFSLYASSAGKQIDDIAYTLNVQKTNLANAGDGGIIQSATLTMTVSKTWVDAHGGVDALAVLRRAEDGTTQILMPTVSGPDASGIYTLTIISPNGLSTFSLASVSAVSSGTSGGSSGSYSSYSNNGDTDTGTSSVLSSVSTAQKASLDPSANPWTSQTVNGPTHITKIELQPTGTFSKDFFLETAKPDSLPASIPKPDVPVYELHKISVYHATSDDINKAKIEFTVPQSYLDSQKRTYRDVQLMRFHNNAWEKLPTEYIGEKDSGHLYRATTAGFSYFATVLVKDATTIPVTTAPTSAILQQVSATPAAISTQHTVAPTIVRTQAAPLVAEAPPQPGFPLPVVAFGIAAIVIVAVCAVIIRRWHTRRQNPALFREYR
jgi:PGF-pre-PGF domain-containing protein